MRQTIYNLVSLGANFNYHRNDFYLTVSHGFENYQSGYMPKEIGGGKFNSEKCYNAISFAWGYKY